MIGLRFLVLNLKLLKNLNVFKKCLVNFLHVEFEAVQLSRFTDDTQDVLQTVFKIGHRNMIKLR